MKFTSLRRPLAVVAGVATVATLAACSPADNAANADKDGELTSVTIQIDGSAVPYYAPLYEAVEQGYFEAEGLDVEFTYAEASSVLQNVAAGNVEFGFPNGDSVITAKANGVDVEVVHTTYQQGIGAVLFNEETNPINAPEDLAGKKIAVTDLGSPNYIQLQAMLTDAGLTLADVEVVTVGTGAIVAALQNGEVDAIAFSRLRYFALESAGFPVGQLLADEFLPSFGNVLVSSPSFREENPEAVAGFVAALDKGIQYVIDNTEESTASVIKKYADSFAGQEEQIAKVLADVYIADLWQSEGTKEHGFGYANLERWQAAIDAQVSFGLIGEAFDAESLVVEPGDL
ncbi:ABC transporter substrate-binding protein [Salinibacterium sp. dk2585]|uniref:ABC transporter substrate-binding protein n=1 Tax=unclassified Salinibacterium TaxID=2632331 RepID=UPI0011C24829|nr:MULTISPECIES: ABC transporter substrate-binding protein [unclassified Salinibacterium]QEE62389.1 ABC transporter substrate-binding protein [Salinibacterium sp. dk2585]TXK52728.1 ABC transporter substrate-binding protein [Salinibacterium sp. dk5596]